MVAAPGRVLGRWGVLMVVAQTVTAIPDHSTETIVRLDMNRVHRNGEIDRLLANYKSAQESPSDLSSIKRVLLSFMAQASERAWWNDELTTATTESQTKQTFLSLEAVETRIRSGEGSHTINVLVGGQERELIIDTGSGKTAFICDGCTDCGSNHKHEPFRHTNNTKFLACNPINKGNPDLGGCMACVESKCRYGQKYVEGDYWEAYKMTDMLSFNPQGTNLPSLEARIEFGCIYAQTGCFNEQTSDGIMGFSRHPDAIYEQFYRQKATQSRIFAQCLAADGGALTIGGVDMHLNTSPVAYTPLLHTGYQYWTVNLESISIGSTQLAVDRQVLNSERGCVLDSGTTFVYLPTAVKAAFVGAWRQARGGSEDNLPVSDTYHHIPDSSLQELPSICFHFAHDAHLCMKPDAYMYKLSANEYAGTIFFGDEARSTIVGASALMHHNIIYDVDNNRVGMAEANCDASILSSADLATERMIALELHPGGDTFRSPNDHEYWAQVGLAAVALVAVGGLVLTIWEELRRPPTTANTKITMPDPEGIVTPLLGAVGHENEGEDFSFYLMPDDA